MLKTVKTIVTTTVRGGSIGVCLAVLMLVIGADEATAVEVPGLYTAEVPYDDSASEGRNDAYKAALIEVLTRVSGSELSRSPMTISDLFPNPASYVTQFRPGDADTLWVSFDGDAIERVLRNAGQTVWGGDRPLTLVWLAVDWGQGNREIIAADEPDQSTRRSRSIDRNRLLRERMLEIAADRGLPLAFPLLDTTDLQGVAFSDIWGGFDERILEASKRYQTNSVLIGRVRPSSSQNNRWSYYFGSEERAWTGSPETVVARIADRLAAEFSIGGNEPLELVTLSVSGVESVDAYGSVQQILDTVVMIEKVRIAAVSGDTIDYQVEVRGGESRLRRALRFAGLIEQERSNRPDGINSAAALEFFYSP